MSRIPQDKLHPILVGAVSNPEAERYATQFLYFFQYYKIPIIEIYADHPDNTILFPLTTREFGRSTGISIAVHDVKNLPEPAKVFLDAMESAGFSIHLERFMGKYHTKARLY
jgi:hypothetical protein